MERRISLVNFIKSMRVRHKIIVFYMSLVFVSTLLSVVVYFQISSDYLDRTVYDLSINEVKAHDRSLVLLLEDINAYSKEIISSPSIQTALDPDQDQFYRLKQVDQELAASMMFDNKISSVYVFDFEGKKYYRDKQIFKNLQLEDIMAKVWYQDLVDLKGGYLYNFNGDGLIADDGHDYLSFFRIINSNVDHQPVGLMMINVEDTLIQEFFNLEVDSFRSVVIHDRTYGTEMAFSTEAEAPVTKELYNILDKLAEAPIYGDEVRVNKEVYNLTGLRNDQNQWDIVEARSGIDRSSMAAIFNAAVIVILLINSVMIIYGSYIFSGYFTNPIVKLTKSMKAVEEGSFIPVDLNQSHDEVAMLQSGYNYMIVEIQRLIEDSIREQQVLKDAELRVILEQIKPHFMYNTLDSINSLVLLGRSEDANVALTALAKFYRNSLSDGRTEVTLETELEIIKNYLLIQNIRYANLFEVNFEIDEEALKVTVPKLMLQPLIENALYHGIRPMGMDGEIIVRVEKLPSGVKIEVEDNGMGISQDIVDQMYKEALDNDIEMSSIGLPATIKRVHHMFGDKGKFEIDNSGDGTVIRIEIESSEGGL